jgi:hypothetical protein
VKHSDERHATLAEVTCDRCGAMVDVAKFSPQHTSVQWNAGAVRSCAEFCELAASGNGGTAARGSVIRGCASLWESIDQAVRDGRLEVKSP